MCPFGDGRLKQALKEHKNVSMDRSQSTSGHLCVDGHGLRRRDYIRKTGTIEELKIEREEWQWFTSIKTTVTILCWT